MELTNKNISEFQELYKKRFGMEISTDEAKEQSAKLLRLMSVVYRPMTQAEFDAVQTRRDELSKNDGKPKLKP